MNTTDTAGRERRAAARQLIRQVVNAHWGEQGGAVADAILTAFDSAGYQITPTDAASAAAEGNDA